MANRKKRLERERKAIETRRKYRSLMRAIEAREPDQIKALIVEVVQTGKVPDPKHPFFDPLYYFRKTLRAARPIRGESIRKILLHPKLVLSQIGEYTSLINWMEYGTAIRYLDDWKAPRSNASGVLFHSLMNHLFVQYSMPDCVWRELKVYYHDEKIKRLFHHLAKGGGVHKAPVTEYRELVNSKGNYFFERAPKELSLLPALHWARMRQRGFSESLAARLIHIQTKYQMGLEPWMLELKGFVDRTPDLTSKKLAKILHFILQQRYRIDLPKVKIQGYRPYWMPIEPLYPDFSVKGRTWTSIIRMIKTWEDYVNAHQELGSNYQFPEPPVKPIRWKGPNGRDFRVVHLDTPIQLIDEGNAMQHCVGTTYQGVCRSGKSSIWSVRYYDHKRIKRLATIEITKDKSVGEFQGKCNTGPSEMVRQVIRVWAQREGINFG